jgi:hypothetical protein
MFQFGEDLFFVGQASCSTTPEEGRDASFQRGLRELLNYAQTSSPTGLTLATQMMYEEPNTPGCPTGTTSVWRLLRVDAAQVAKLPKYSTPPSMASSLPPPTPLVNMTPRIGMSREHILAIFGHPRTISMFRGGQEAHWDYPRFGLMLGLDAQGYLLHWHLAGPQASRTAPPPHAESRIPVTADSSPPVDLTNRLQALEAQTHPEVEQEAATTCAARFPSYFRQVDDIRAACERREVERLKRSGGRR